jgi:putative radical SAM enzyme (TIGR03279 family)
MFEVESVVADSAAYSAGMLSGDIIVTINGEALMDYIDYVYFCSREKLRIRLLRDGLPVTVRVWKSAEEDLGLCFTQPLLGKKRVCGNRCIFCFVDQLPKGMRKSLYVKDEDWRYSLIMGNYVTLSDISRKEFARILRRKASPLYISVHTVDEAQRRRMLGNKRGMSIRPVLKKIAGRGMRFHAQAVICPGVNDGAALEQTYRFLRGLYPAAMSLAVVPVGLTDHRKGLTPITSVTKEMAQITVKEVEKWQKECLNSIGSRFVFLADEYYLRAGLPLPPAESYESFCQIENGVGLVAKLLLEAEEALGSCRTGSSDLVSIATGEDALPFIEDIAKRAARVCGADIRVYGVKNLTFGGGVTVAGLLGGRDFLEALTDKPLGKRLLIPAAALRDDNVFLDDMTLDELSATLGVPVKPAADAFELIEYITGN